MHDRYAGRSGEHITTQLSRYHRSGITGQVGRLAGGTHYRAGEHIIQVSRHYRTYSKADISMGERSNRQVNRYYRTGHCRIGRLGSRQRPAAA